MVLKNNDSTAHGEISAIRDAEQALGTYDLTKVLARFALEKTALSLKAVQRIQSKDLLKQTGNNLLHNDPYEVVPYCAMQIGDIDLLAQCALTDPCDSCEWRKKYEVLMQDPRYAEIAAKLLVYRKGN